MDWKGRVAGLKKNQKLMFQRAPTTFIRLLNLHLTYLPSWQTDYVLSTVKNVQAVNLHLALTENK